MCPRLAKKDDCKSSSFENSLDLSLMRELLKNSEVRKAITIDLV